MPPRSAPLFRQIASLFAGSVGAALALVAGGACGSCSHGVTANGLAEGKSSATPPSEAPHATVADDPPVAAHRCDAGSLPRFNENSLPGADIRTLLANAALRPIAVVSNDHGIELLNDCQLNSARYAEIPGRNGKGQFRPVSRLVFRADELGGACGRATHVVAAFAVDGPSGRSEAASKPAGPPPHIEGVLIPLPCPSVADQKPAPGCVGKGLTGNQRRNRAKAIWPRLPREEGAFADVAQPLELYALVPDHFWGVTLSRWVQNRTLLDQASWLGNQYDFGKVVPPHGQEDWMVDHYAPQPEVEPPGAKLKEASRRDPPPTFYWSAHKREIIFEPPFMYCFPRLVDPDVTYHVIF